MRTISPGIGNIDPAGTGGGISERKALLRNIALLTLLVVVNVLVMMMVIKFVNSPSE